MSSAFGITSNCQANPNDDVAAKVTRAMTPGVLQKIVFALVFVLPFKKLLFNSKWISQTIFKNWSIVNSLAQQMIEMKRKGDTSGRKVRIFYFVVRIVFFKQINKQIVELVLKVISIT